MSDFNSSFRRVVITGLGAITPLGHDVASSWQASVADADSPALAQPLEAGVSANTAMPIRGFDPRPYFRSPKSIKLADRKAQLAVAAAVMAFDDAGLEVAPYDRERIGISMGSGSAELQVEDLAKAIGPGAELRPADDLPFFACQILSNLNPLWLLVSLPNMISAHVSIQLQVMGPNTTLMTDWIAGTQAVGEAWLWIRSGEADCVLAGGADCSISPLDLFGWAQIADESNPFAGCHPAEGAAVLVLEELESAVARNARMYGEVCAYSSGSSDGIKNMCDVIAASMGRTIMAAGWSPAEIGLILTAACGKGEIGLAESRAIRQLMKLPMGKLPVTEFKSRMGHLLAACGPAEMALLLHGRNAGRTSFRILCNAAGSNGQFACIAISSPPIAGHAVPESPAEE
jgi:3-oxoacyl-[acyl-carrier-protein] synthase II